MTKALVKQSSAEQMLAEIDGAIHHLAECHDIEDLKVERNKGEALRILCQKAGTGLIAQNKAAKYKIFVERRIGELLKDMEQREERRTKGDSLKKLPEEVTSKPPTLKDLGMSTKQAHQWQIMAKVPRKDLDEHITIVNDRKLELTSKSVYNMGKAMTGSGTVKTESRDITIAYIQTTTQKAKELRARIDNIRTTPINYDDEDRVDTLNDLLSNLLPLGGTISMALKMGQEQGGNTDEEIETRKLGS